MEKNQLKEQFKQICNLCFQDENSKELHQEIISIQQVLKKDGNKDEEKYLIAMKQVIDIIDIFAEEFDPELKTEIEQIYLDATESFL